MITTWRRSIKYVGAARPLIYGWYASGGFVPLIPASARGSIAFDQLKVSSRAGNGSQLLTWNTSPPVLHNSTGAPNQIAYDSLGNFYWCYNTNQWARIGPGGYSNTF